MSDIILKRPALYQVYVEDGGKELAVFPKGPKEVIDHLADAIRSQIAQGLEKRWSNPHVVPVL